MSFIADLYKLGPKTRSFIAHSLKPLLSFFFLRLFLAALGLRCCGQAFSSCSEQGLLFVTEHRL